MLKRIRDFLAYVAELAVIGGCYIWRWKRSFILMVLVVLVVLAMFCVFMIFRGLITPAPDTEWARILANTSHLMLMGVW